MNLSISKQTFHKKIIKALLFHGLLLLCAIIGIIYQQQFPSTQLARDITFYYWLFLCILPIIYILVSNPEKRTRETLPPDYPDGLTRPFCKLRDFSFIRTFALFYRDAQPAKKNAIWIITVIFLAIVLECLQKCLCYHLLWFVGFFFTFMLCRYIYVLYTIPSIKIVLTQEKLMLPVFGLTGVYYSSLAWKDVTELEIIGAEAIILKYTSQLEELLLDSYTNPTQAFDKNIAFIRGLIFHYKKNNKHYMLTIVDTMLNTLTLYKIYYYSNNYREQQNLKLRLTYGKSPIYVCWPDETWSSAKVIAQICLDEASKV
jgi:hypothetical protein